MEFSFMQYLKLCFHQHIICGKYFENTQHVFALKCFFVGTSTDSIYMMIIAPPPNLIYII